MTRRREPFAQPSAGLASFPGARAEAVALRYAAGDGAPHVVAKGRGITAEAIIERAREHGVYVHQSPELVSLLMQVNLDDRIPPQLYIAVAELLAWIYRQEHHTPAPHPATADNGIRT